MNIEKLAQEYQRIGFLKQISDSEAERLEEILEVAELNPELNSLLNEIDLRIAHKQGLLNPENMSYLEDQRNKLLKNIEYEMEKRESYCRLTTSLK